MSTTTISPRKSSRERKSRQTAFNATDDPDTDDPESLIGDDDDTELIDDAEL